MKKIEVEKAINSGDWYEYRDDDKKFRIRFLGFRKVDLKEIDNIENVDNDLPVEDGKLLLLSTELINLSKEETGSIYISLFDDDKCRFDKIECSYLTSNSRFASRNKLRYVSYLPKFKYKRDFIYLVPDEESKYYLTTQYDSDSLSEL